MTCFSFSEMASPAATKKSAVFNTKTDINSLHDSIENYKKKLAETINKKLPIILSVENGFETAAEITVLHQEIEKQEKVYQQLVAQGERYKSLLETMERITEQYVRACEELRTSTTLAKQSKLNSVKSTDFMKNLQSDCDTWEKNKNHSMAALKGSNSVQDPRSATPLWDEESTGTRTRTEAGPGPRTGTGTKVARREHSGLLGNSAADECGDDALGYRECNIRIRGRDSLVFALNSVMTQGGVEGDMGSGMGMGVGQGQSGVERGMSRLGLSGGDERQGRVSEMGRGRESTERERERDRGRGREGEKGGETDRSFTRSVDRSTGRSRERNRGRERNKEQSSDGFYEYFIKDSDTVRDQDRTNDTNRTYVTNITNVLTGTNIIPDETFLGEKIFLSDAVENVCTYAHKAQDNRKKLSVGIGRTSEVISGLRDVLNSVEKSSANLMLKQSKNKENSPFKKRSNNGRNKPNLEPGNMDNLIAVMKEVSEIKEFHRVELTSLFMKIDSKKTVR